jgi:hypothetical protein
MLKAMKQPRYRAPAALLSIGWKMLDGLLAITALRFLLTRPASRQDPAIFFTRFLQLAINEARCGIIYLGGKRRCLTQ